MRTFHPPPDLEGCITGLTVAVGERVAVDALVRFLPHEASELLQFLERELEALTERPRISEPVTELPGGTFILGPEDALWYQMNRLAVMYLRARLDADSADDHTAACVVRLVENAQPATALLLGNAVERHILEVFAVVLRPVIEESPLPRLIEVLQAAKAFYGRLAESGYETGREDSDELEEAFNGYCYALAYVEHLAARNTPHPLTPGE
jgi:hypothetical protein